MISEAAVKKCVADYLETGMTMGKWYSDRLNSGMLLADYKGKKRAIHLCRPGTADFVIFQNTNRNDVPFAYAFKNVRLIFIETKRPKNSKQRESQKEFEALVTKQGAEYYICKSLEELQEVLPL